MIPAGYLLKRVVPPPTWLVNTVNPIEDVCSVSNCINENVVDLQKIWLHNSFGLANSSDILTSLATQDGCGLKGTTLFYYTAYEFELPSDGWTFDPNQWRPRTPMDSAQVVDDVKSPLDQGSVSLLGYDVVVFLYGPNHSPLSCNSVAQQIPVNKHCLFNSFENAIAAINNGAFGSGCEEGMYTVFTVERME